jgi:hypothetical protein
LDFDLEFGLIAKDVWISIGHEFDLVKCVRCVGDELSQENFLLGVKGVDDDVHESADLSYEWDLLGFTFCSEL